MYSPHFMDKENFIEVNTEQYYRTKFSDENILEVSCYHNYLNWKPFQTLFSSNKFENMAMR